MVFVYKMLFGLVDMNFCEYFTLRGDYATRGHEYKLFINCSRLNVRKHVCTERVVAVWNNLDNSVIKFSSVSRILYCCVICPNTLVFLIRITDVFSVVVCCMF